MMQLWPVNEPRQAKSESNKDQLLVPVFDTESSQISCSWLSHLYSSCKVLYVSHFISKKSKYAAWLFKMRQAIFCMYLLTVINMPLNCLQWDKQYLAQLHGLFYKPTSIIVADASESLWCSKQCLALLDAYPLFLKLIVAYWCWSLHDDRWHFSMFWLNQTPKH